MSTSSLLAVVLLNPRALMAHWRESTCATCRLPARRSASGRLDAPERRMSSRVITWIAEAVCASRSARFETEVTSRFISCSMLSCFNTSADTLVSRRWPEESGCWASPGAAKQTTPNVRTSDVAAATALVSANGRRPMVRLTPLGSRVDRVAKDYPGNVCVARGRRRRQSNERALYPPSGSWSARAPSPRRSLPPWICAERRLFERNLVLVPGQPLPEGLQLRVEYPREIDVPHLAIVIVEVALELKHVAQVGGTGKAEAAVDLGRDGVVPHLLTERPGEGGRHFRAREVLARDADRLADELAPTLEDPVRALADVFGSDGRELLLIQREGDRQLAVRSPLRARAEVDQVVPVEGCQQERGRYAEVAEDRVRFGFGVKVRHLVLAHQGGHPVVVERHPLARVFEGRPDHVLEPGGLRRSRHVAGLGQLPLGREVLPEIRDTEGAVGSRERPINGPGLVGICRDDLHTRGCKRLRLLGVDVPCDGAGPERAALVSHHGAHQPSTLRAGCSDNRDDLS